MGGRIKILKLPHVLMGMFLLKREIECAGEIDRGGRSEVLREIGVCDPECGRRPLVPLVFEQERR